MKSNKRYTYLNGTEYKTFTSFRKMLEWALAFPLNRTRNLGESGRKGERSKQRGYVYQRKRKCQRIPQNNKTRRAYLEIVCDTSYQFNATENTRALQKQDL